jgi:hypothetical protein
VKPGIFMFDGSLQISELNGPTWDFHFEVPSTLQYTPTTILFVLQPAVLSIPDLVYLP